MPRHPLKTSTACTPHNISSSSISTTRIKHQILMSYTPTLPQERALAYAPLPFSALSVLSSCFVFYYLVSKHPNKLERIYHRLVLSAFACIFVLSCCILWGNSALPAGSDFVGASGNDSTCSVQGGLYVISGLALASYYASFSIYGLVSVKNNFKQEKIRWIEKWIHLWAHGSALTVFVGMAVQMRLDPKSDPFCRMARLHVHYEAIPWSMYVYIYLIRLNYVIGISGILFLWCNFTRIQKNVDNAVGMTRMIESARKRRHKEVTVQTGLYLFLFSYGHLVPIVASYAIALSSKSWVYDLAVAAVCMSASQGVVFMIIYFACQNPEEGNTLSSLNTGVADIRQKAQDGSRKKKLSIRPRFSFNIFDGTPAEDSPWKEFIDNESDDGDDDRCISEPQEEESTKGLKTSLL